MKETNRIVIPIKGNKKWGWPPRSLHWHKDELIDWVGGIVRYQLDKTIIPPRVGFAFSFDYAEVSPNGDYVALIQRLGTKGVILKQGQLIREINRSYYYAEHYEYPLVFCNLPDGRTGLIHCPDEYCKLEIEDAETGERLTQRSTKPADFFHSRLSVSANNRYLLSAGWIWHPFEDLYLYEIERVLAQPSLLDAGEIRLSRWGVTIPTGFLTQDNCIILATADDYYDPADVDADNELRLPPNMLAKYSIPDSRFLSQVPTQEPVGILLPIDDQYVLSCYKHIKLIDVSTGQIAARWEELKTSQQTSCIVGQDDLLPPIAIDRVNKRFAIASHEEITIIELG